MMNEENKKNKDGILGAPIIYCPYCRTEVYRKESTNTGRGMFKCPKCSKWFPVDLSCRIA